MQPAIFPKSDNANKMSNISSFVINITQELSSPILKLIERPENQGPNSTLSVTLTLSIKYK